MNLRRKIISQRLFDMQIEYVIYYTNSSATLQRKEFFNYDEAEALNVVFKPIKVHEFVASGYDEAMSYFRKNRGRLIKSYEEV